MKQRQNNIFLHHSYLFFYQYIYVVSPAVRLPGDSVIHPSDLNLDQIRSPPSDHGTVCLYQWGDGCFSFCKLRYLYAFILYYLLQTGLYMAKKPTLPYGNERVKNATVFFCRGIGSPKKTGS
jgi:hypothetical protein